MYVKYSVIFFWIGWSFAEINDFLCLNTRFQKFDLYVLPQKWFDKSKIRIPKYFYFSNRGTYSIFLVLAYRRTSWPKVMKVNENLTWWCMTLGVPQTLILFPRLDKLLCRVVPFEGRTFSCHPPPQCRISSPLEISVWWSARSIVQGIRFDIHPWNWRGPEYLIDLPFLKGRKKENFILPSA